MLTYLTIIVLGLFVGSFLNCVAYRLEIKESFLKGRSYCPHCKKTIAWFDLIPVFSFFALKGRCRNCSSKISWQYPVVEASTALMFLLVFNYFSELSLSTIVYYWFIVSIFILVFVYDYKHLIIPDSAVIFAVALSLLWLLFQFLNQSRSLEEISIFIFSGIGASMFLFFFFLASKGQWMGFGDVKLAFAMGLFLGFPEIVTAFLISFFAGGIFGLIAIFLKRKNLKSEVPFAPFLIIGTFVALFWGEVLLTLYLGSFRIY